MVQRNMFDMSHRPVTCNVVQRRGYAGGRLISPAARSGSDSRHYGIQAHAYLLEGPVDKTYLLPWRVDYHSEEICSEDTR